MCMFSGVAFQKQMIVPKKRSLFVQQGEVMVVLGVPCPCKACCEVLQHKSSLDKAGLKYYRIQSENSFLLRIVHYLLEN